MIFATTELQCNLVDVMRRALAHQAGPNATVIPPGFPTILNNAKVCTRLGAAIYGAILRMLAIRGILSAEGFNLS